MLHSSWTTSLVAREESASRKWSIIPYFLILSIVSSGVVGARLWTRKVLQKQFALEDWLILVGLILSLVILGGIVLAVLVFKFDKHTSDLTPAQLVLAAEWLFIGEFAYVASVGTIKVGILLFYRRLAARKNGNGFMYTLYFCITFILVYKVIYITVILNTCHPLVARWRREDPEYVATHHFTCINEAANIFTGSTISATEDLVIALLPSFVLWHVRIPWRQKIALICIFSMSMLTSAAGYLRSYFIWQAASTNDHIWNEYWLWTCSGIELSLGLICACAPALKPFCEHFKFGTKLSNLFKPLTSTAKRMMTKLKPKPSSPQDDDSSEHNNRKDGFVSIVINSHDEKPKPDSSGPFSAGKSAQNKSTPTPPSRDSETEEFEIFEMLKDSRHTSTKTYVEVRSVPSSGESSLRRSMSELKDMEAQR